MAVIDGYDGFNLESVTSAPAAVLTCVCSTTPSSGMSSISELFLVAYIVTVLFMMMLLAISIFLFWRKKLDYTSLKNLTQRLFLAMGALLGNAMPSMGGYKFAWRIIEPAILEVVDQIIQEKTIDVTTDDDNRNIRNI